MGFSGAAISAIQRAWVGDINEYKGVSSPDEGQGVEGMPLLCHTYAYLPAPLYQPHQIQSHINLTQDRLSLGDLPTCSPYL